MRFSQTRMKSSWSTPNQVFKFKINLGKLICFLKAHIDFGFCLDWNPSVDFQLASGSQDGSCLVWDIRKSSAPVHTLMGKNSPVYAIKYSKTGKLRRLIKRKFACLCRVVWLPKNIFGVELIYKMLSVWLFWGDVWNELFAKRRGSLF